jgi:hypothetical protein
MTSGWETIGERPSGSSAPKTLHLRDDCAVTKHGPVITGEESFCLFLAEPAEPESTLNRLLLPAALGDHARAHALTALYISKLEERLPHAHRWHLELAGIDADAIYID